MNLRSVFSVGLLMLATCAAYAQTDNFDVTTGANSFTFSLPASPTPSGTSCLSFLDNFCVTGVAVTFDGTPQTDEILFFDSTDYGGLLIYNNSSATYLLDQEGAVLFSGSDSVPTFLLGSFADDEVSPYPAGQVQGDTTVNISATPEPSSLMLLGSGVLGVAGVVRRRFHR